MNVPSNIILLDYNVSPLREKADDLVHQGIEVRKIDLVHDSIDQLFKKLYHVDNIIFDAAENQYRPKWLY